MGVVEQPGAQCTVQDLGRKDGRRVGLAPGGAMDQLAYLWGNRLLENGPEAPMLEVALGGLTMRFEEDSLVALTGADCGATVDGNPVGVWRTVSIRHGQKLRLGYCATGMRAYIAFPGGLDVPAAWGSASAVLRDGLPGLLGRPLGRGEELRWRDPGRTLNSRRLSHGHIPKPPTEVALPLITGYEWDQFSFEDQELVFSGTWKMDPASDRTACRLRGPVLASGPRALDSVPLVDGTVQITGDGVPLVFMRDRPTIGGYAKLGSVGSAALDDLAQTRPGTPIRFFRGDPPAMRRKMVQRETFFGI